jgi:hypothetical protein
MNFKYRIRWGYAPLILFFGKKLMRLHDPVHIKNKKNFSKGGMTLSYTVILYKLIIIRIKIKLNLINIKTKKNKILYLNGYIFIRILLKFLIKIERLIYFSVP